MLLAQAGANVLAPNCGDFANYDTGQDFTFNAGKRLIKARIPFKCANFAGKDIAGWLAGSLTEHHRTALCSQASLISPSLRRKKLCLSSRGFDDVMRPARFLRNA